MDAETIGQYRVTGLIGQGGMGAVYAAEHTLLGRPAAIKVLLPELSRKQDVVTRFFNEARAATAIRHPGIIEVYDFGWTPDGAAFIVMEYLEGETLGHRASQARLPWQTALAIARQIAGALSAAHAKGIVHRDLKPDNVFLVRDPEVPGGERIKLLDFGIAKLAGEASTSANVTKTGAVMGTPTYMAPEQCRGITVDHRADLYSLGCIVFELCGGRPPFVGEGSGDVLAAHIHLAPPSLASLRVEVPRLVEQLIDRLLAKQPAQRVQTADDLIQLIDRISGARAPLTTLAPGGPRAVTSAPSITTLSGAATNAERHTVVVGTQRRRPIAIIAAVGAAASAAVVALIMRGGSDDAPRITVRPAAGAAAAVIPAPPDRVAAPTPDPIPPAPAPSPNTAAAPDPGPPAASPPTASAPSASAPTASAPTASAPTASAPTASAPTTSAASAAPAPASPTAPTASPTAPSASAAPAPTASTASTASAASAAAPAPASPTAPTPRAPSVSPTTSPAATKPPLASRPRIAEPARPLPEPSRPRAPAPGAAVVDLHVQSVPAGAQVLLGGTVLGKTPYHGSLPSRGRDVTLTVRLAGFADKVITARGDQPISERIKLVKAAPPRSRQDRDKSVNPFGD